MVEEETQRRIKELDSRDSNRKSKSVTKMSTKENNHDENDVEGDDESSDVPEAKAVNSVISKTNSKNEANGLQHENGQNEKRDDKSATADAHHN